MLKLFRPKPRSILGVDIGSSSVKILEISGTENKLCVEGYGRETLPAQAIDGGVIKDIDLVAWCIKRVIAKAFLTSQQVAVAVPDSAVISKIVQINDGLNAQEMEELVIIEADKYIPYPIDEINIDFEVIGPSTKNTAMLDVLIVASRAENVNSRVEAITRAGLEAKIVDVESYAVERSVQLLAKELPAAGQDKIVAIIDIGANYSSLFVLNGMKLVFSREEKFGSMQLINALVENYKMTSEEAVDAIREGKLPEDYETNVLKPFKKTVLLQIKRTLQFFYSTSQHNFVDLILLAGGIARQPGLRQDIQEELGIITSIANPLAPMSFSKRVDLNAINSDAPALMVACGLALRNID